MKWSETMPNEKTPKEDDLKYEVKYWHRCFCIAMSVLGSTWGALIGSLVIWILAKR